jgi:gliding motility-associated lipoprotein GldD
MIKMRTLVLFIGIMALALSSCQQEYSPKPRGYYRIDLPTRTGYDRVETGCAYSFDIPNYAVLVDDSSRDARTCWKNVVYKGLNGRLHLSYYALDSKEMLFELIEDSRKLVFKHTVKADGIDESLIRNDQAKVYGLLYDIGGNTASSYQFFVTDSNKHFLRAALYFYANPQADSLQPVLNFVKADIDQMLKSFEWR